MLTRNIVAGIAGVDARAGRRRARLRHVARAGARCASKFPQALPVLIGGVRIAAIAMIAIATLGGYVGGVGLGVLIFNGLTLHQPQMIVAGSVAASALAIAVDVLLRYAERRTRIRLDASIFAIIP